MNTEQDEHISWIEHGVNLIRSTLNQSTLLNPEEKREILRLTWAIRAILDKAIERNK